MVAMLGRPCAIRTVFSGSNPCCFAHQVQTRATAGVESTSTPSRSNSTPLQEIFSMLHDTGNSLAEKIPLELSGLHAAKFSCVPAAPLTLLFLFAFRGSEPRKMKRKLQVMKFGGTSVGDAACIHRSAQIVARAAAESAVVAVVSAMSGVTNRLIDAAHRAGRGDREAGTILADSLRQQHCSALGALVRDAAARAAADRRLEEILAEARRLYEGTSLLRELTPRTLDAISGLGERLCAPIFAAALGELGVGGDGVEATELIVTDSYHGGAEPLPQPTRARSSARL